VFVIFENGRTVAVIELLQLGFAVVEVARA